MNTTTTTSSSAPLAHSLNSRGELGAFVNPFTCPCTTCCNYMGEEPTLLLPQPTSPLVRQTAVGCGVDSLSAIPLRRAPANQVWTGAQWVHKDSELGQAILSECNPSFTTTSSSSSRPQAYVGTPKSAVHIPTAAAAEAEANSVSLLSAIGAAAIAEREEQEQEEEEDLHKMPESLAIDLRMLRARLHIRQDAVYRGAESQQDISIADQEFEDLDQKIRAIEQLLFSFRAIFRTR